MAQAEGSVLLPIVNDADRGAWYFAFDIQTALEEVIFRKGVDYAKIDRFHDPAVYQGRPADFNASFHEYGLLQARAGWQREEGRNVPIDLERFSSTGSEHMNAFDVRTAFMIIAMMYVTLPVFTWIVLAPQRQQAVGHWCGGGLITGAAFLLIGVHGNPSDLASHAAANLLLVFGFLTRIQALRMDLGTAWPKSRVIFGAVAVVALYEALHYLAIGETSHLVVVGLLYVFRLWLILHLAMLARRISIEESSPSARWIARVYFLVAAAVVVRELQVISGLSSENVLAPGIDMLAVSLAFVLASVVGHIGYVGLALDRSLRREIEAATLVARDEVSVRLGKKIAHLDRQRSLGTMAASLGHELNQPLTAILLSAQVARRGVMAGRFNADQLSEFLETIVTSTHRAGQIIERIRGFIRPTDITREPVDLAMAVQRVRLLVADEAKSRGVIFLVDPMAVPLWVMGDAVQLSQVVLNIVRNSLDAMADRVRQEIHISLHRQAGRVVLCIRDTGPGLPSDILSKIGKPFFTTKPTGLGMGLSISRSIVEQFDGQLSIDNADQGGTMVQLNFPALP